jgi:hypothetical protein
VTSGGCNFAEAFYWPLKGILLEYQCKIDGYSTTKKLIVLVIVLPTINVLTEGAGVRYTFFFRVSI